MPAQSVADFLDGAFKTGRDGSPGKIAGQLVGDRRPERVAAMLVDARIADDGEGPAFGGEIDQHAVPVLGAVHAQTLERLAGGGLGVGRGGFRDANAEFPGRPGFGATDRLEHLGFLGGREKRGRFHDVFTIVRWHRHRPKSRHPQKSLLHRHLLPPSRRRRFAIRPGVTLRRCGDRAGRKR